MKEIILIQKHHQNKLTNQNTSPKFINLLFINVTKLGCCRFVNSLTAMDGRDHPLNNELHW